MDLTAIFNLTENLNLGFPPGKGKDSGENFSLLIKSFIAKFNEHDLNLKSFTGEKGGEKKADIKFHPQPYYLQEEEISLEGITLVTDDMKNNDNNAIKNSLYVKKELNEYPFLLSLLDSKEFLPGYSMNGNQKLFSGIEVTKEVFSGFAQNENYIEEDSIKKALLKTGIEFITKEVEKGEGNQSNFCNKGQGLDFTEETQKKILPQLEKLKDEIFQQGEVKEEFTSKKTEGDPDRLNLNLNFTKRFVELCSQIEKLKDKGFSFDGINKEISSELTAGLKQTYNTAFLRDIFSISNGHGLKGFNKEILSGNNNENGIAGSFTHSEEKTNCFKGDLYSRENPTASKDGFIKNFSEQEVFVKDTKHTIKQDFRPEKTSPNFPMGNAKTDTIILNNLESKAVLESEPVPLNDKIVNQIIDKVALLNISKKNEILIKLHPPSLGKIRITVSMEKHNMEANLFVEHHSVKEVIENNLHHLRNSLLDHGIKVEKFSIFVGLDENRSSFNLNSGGDSFNRDTDYQENENSDPDLKSDAEEENDSIPSREGNVNIFI
ncbi:MAG: flagellar hook-length control protein FliK [Thermodesulfobacteriota bacterium]|nr:flagellar hook-length control protein FliK [Thermodesulfobacteriota bacterium]